MTCSSSLLCCYAIIIICSPLSLLGYCPAHFVSGFVSSRPLERLTVNHISGPRLRRPVLLFSQKSCYNNGTAPVGQMGQVATPSYDEGLVVGKYSYFNQSTPLDSISLKLPRETISRLTHKRIDATIQSLLGTADSMNKHSKPKKVSRTFQILGERIRHVCTTKPTLTFSSSSSTIVLSSDSSVDVSTRPPASSNSDRSYLLTNGLLTVRVASNIDDLDIARLRLSVFADLSPDDRDSFCVRSCNVIRNRRKRGAFCLVASDASDTVVGTLEGSTHEFAGTQLEMKHPKGSILYVTEVAVSPFFRRCGTGTMLMKV